MEEILRRGWDDLVGRIGGPMSLRLIIQPLVATIFAVIAGLRDAREGRLPFLWAVITKPRRRHELLGQGWRDVGKVFIVAVILDAIYQVAVQGGIFTLELLITATVLALVPYMILRDLVSRVARLVGVGKHEDPSTANDKEITKIS